MEFHNTEEMARIRIEHILSAYGFSPEESENFSKNISVTDMIKLKEKYKFSLSKILELD